MKIEFNSIKNHFDIKAKRFFKSNVFLYKSWFFFTKKLQSNIRLPKKGDQIYFDGFPRSGNTYFRTLLDYAFNKITGSSHLHVIAGIKLAKSKQIKTLIIIRDPVHVIASNVFRKIYNKRDQSKEKSVIYEANKILDEWIEYYSYAIKHIDPENFIIFEQCIDNEEIFLKRIEFTSGFSLKSSSNDITKSFKVYMESLENHKPLSTSSLPNKSRSKFKHDILKQIKEQGRYAVAKDLYHEIVQKSEVKTS